MVAEPDVELVRHSITAWARGDFATAFASFAPEAEWHTADDEPDCETHRGLDALWRLAASFAEPWTNRFDDVMEFDELIPCGPWVLVPWRAHLHGRESGVDVAVGETWAVLVGEGLIRRVEEYRTTDAALEAKRAGGATRGYSPRMAPRSARKTSAAVAETATLRQAEEAAGRHRPAGGPGTADPLLGELRRGGLLPLLVLHLAAEEPAYGNQLIERIGELTAGAVAVNPNTMYPLLRSLEDRGLLEAEWEHPERRSRRFYRATAAGRAERDRLHRDVLPRLDAVAAGIEMIRAELGDGSGR
jgi:DNA-binding PadR family transcriptional regulator/ketosteroid isomerase-like protein